MVEFRDILFTRFFFAFMLKPFVVVAIYCNHGGIINGAEREVNCVKTGCGRRAYIVNITSSRRTVHCVQLGSFLGEYERLLIRNLIR